MYDNPQTNLQIAHQIMQQRLDRAVRRRIERGARASRHRRGPPTSG